MAKSNNDDDGGSPILVTVGSMVIDLVSECAEDIYAWGQEKYQALKEKRNGKAKLEDKNGRVGG